MEIGDQIKNYIRNTTGGGFRTFIKISLHEDTGNFNLAYDHNSMGAGPIKFTLNGTVVMNEPNYKLVAIKK